VPAGSAAGGAGPAGSGSGAAAEMSPTSGFLPDMPQWKKDLIQRRKTNVARTQAASIASPTDGSCGALAVEATTAPGAIAGEWWLDKLVYFHLKWKFEEFKRQVFVEKCTIKFVFLNSIVNNLFVLIIKVIFKLC